MSWPDCAGEMKAAGPASGWKLGFAIAGVPRAQQGAASAQPGQQPASALLPPRPAVLTRQRAWPREPRAMSKAHGWLTSLQFILR